MAEKTGQNYPNHVRLDPPFHFFVLPVAAITIIVAVYRVFTHFSFMSVWLVVLAIAFAVLTLKVRLYALKAQDRIIRLEERLRLSALLDEPLRSRILELTEAQLIALRFASDAEAAALVQKVLSTKLAPSEIKKTIVEWRPDYFRI